MSLQSTRLGINSGPRELSETNPVRADAHPRVTGCSAAVFKGFSSLQKALDYMEKRKVFAPRRMIRERTEASTPGRKSDGYYAVANGKNPGVYRYWRYDLPQ